MSLLFDHAEDRRVVGAAGVNLLAVFPEVPGAALLQDGLIAGAPLGQHPKIEPLVILHVDADGARVLGLPHPLVL